MVLYTGNTFVYFKSSSLLTVLWQGTAARAFATNNQALPFSTRISLPRIPSHPLLSITWVLLHHILFLLQYNIVHTVFYFQKCQQLSSRYFGVGTLSSN